MYMTEKRDRSKLSPLSQNQGPDTKSQKRENNDMSDKELVRMFQELNAKMDLVKTSLDAKMDEVQANIDAKIGNLVTRQDLQVFREEFNSVKEDTLTVKSSVVDIQKEMKTDKKKIEFLERALREKNIVIRGPIRANNVESDIKNLFVEVLKITSEMVIDEIITIGKSDGPLMKVLVKFVKSSSTKQIFKNVKLLAKTKWQIERDYPQEIRQKTSILLKVKKHIRSKLADEKDKKVVIKIIGDRMTINREIFVWRDGGLWSGEEQGYKKLNKIFVYNFNACFFDNLDLTSKPQ